MIDIKYESNRDALSISNNGIANRPLKSSDFYYANEKPEDDSEPIQLDAVQLSQLDKDTIDNLLETAPVGSTVINIYDKYWYDRGTVHQKNIEKVGGYKQNYYAPMPTKYYEVNWCMDGRELSWNSDLTNIILGKSEYYFVADNLTED